MQPKSVVDRVSRFVPQNTHALAFAGAFDFQHLRPLEFHESRMGQVKRYGKTGYAIRCKPFFGQPDMRMEAKGPSLELAIELFDALFQLSSADVNGQIAEPDIEQLPIRHPI